MSTTTPHRFNPAKNYDAIEFRQDKVLQSAELVELQDMLDYRIRGIADALFKDGDIKRDARLVVNPDTGAVQAEAGAIYLQGAMRGVPPGAFTVPTLGIVNVGVYLTTALVTELQDPDLLNPATGSPAYQQPGAARTQVQPAWGFLGDGQPGEFYPVWVIEDGYVRAKEPPPNLDAVTQALARYDRDSAGGSYIVDGMRVAMAADLASGEQVYTVTEGRARVAGFGFEQQASRRLVYTAQPELLMVDSEPHLSETAGAQRITIGRPPMRGVPQVRITARKTVPITRGGFGGGADPLPDAAVVKMESVKQGGTTFVPATDYKLTGGQVDWSPNGGEPTPGSTYEVTYLHISSVAPTAVDPRGFTVEGAVPGTTTLVTYEQMLRRIDRLCMNSAGGYEWVRGVASAWTPTPPVVPADMLQLASVYQSWDEARTLINDGIKTVPMQRLVGEQRRLDGAILDIAELRLATSAQGIDAGIKKGQFVDPFLDDSSRDAGQAQTAAIVGGALQLPLVSAVHQLATLAPLAPAYTWRVVLEQPWRTGSMLVNPYMAFDPIPAAITLLPNVDRWTDVQTQWASAITERLYTGSGSVTTLAGRKTAARVLSEESRPLEFLRSIPVRFDIAGWGPGEPLGAVTFDGIAVAPQPLAGATLQASPAGVLSGTFTIPEKVPAGAKEVRFTGTLGSRGSNVFTGQGTEVIRQQQNVTTETWAQSSPVQTGGDNQVVVGPSDGGSANTGYNASPKCSQWAQLFGVDPLAQTFVVDTALQCAGVDLQFTAKSGPVVVQIRATSNGVPTATVLAECRLPADAIDLAGYSRATWPPTVLDARTEYAIVVLCDDATTALAVAELGKQDPTRGYVTSQPYQVGVLLSSSNASTWTPHQDRDMTFRLLAARYTEAERVIDLGTADVVDATDLMLLGYADKPTARAGLVFEVEFPQAMGSPVVRLTDGQIVWLAAPFTGPLKVRARLSGDADMAAVLWPGVQLVAGTLRAQATYITRTVAGDADGRLVVVFEGDIPGGSAVQVHVQSAEAGAPWVQVPYLSASANTAGVREITHQLEHLNAPTGARVRLTLAGSTVARPYVRNLRCVVL